MDKTKIRFVLLMGIISASIWYRGIFVLGQLVDGARPLGRVMHLRSDGDAIFSWWMMVGRRDATWNLDERGDILGKFV